MSNRFINLEIKEREDQFQEAYKVWKETGSKEAWDIMFHRVYDCCHNIAAKLLTGVRIDPEAFEDRLMDSCCYIMERIQKGTVIGKLSSYAYLAVKGKFYSPKRQFEDKISYVDDMSIYANERRTS